MLRCCVGTPLFGVEFSDRLELTKLIVGQQCWVTLPKNFRELVIFNLAVGNASANGRVDQPGTQTIDPVERAFFIIRPIE